MLEVWWSWHITGIVRRLGDIYLIPLVRLRYMFRLLLLTNCDTSWMMGEGAVPGFGSVLFFSLYSARVYSLGCFFLLGAAGLSFGRRGFARLQAMNWHFSRFTMCCLTCDICLASWGGSISSMTLANYKMIKRVINKPLRDYTAVTWWHGQPVGQLPNPKTSQCRGPQVVAPTNQKITKVMLLWLL